VYSTADKDALHVRLADIAVCIGPPKSAQSYLSVPALITTAIRTGCEAVHPGVGFLSENSNFAREVKKAGLIRIPTLSICSATRSPRATPHSSTVCR